MPKAQAKQASAGRKTPVKKVAARVKGAVAAAKKKVAAKKPAAAPKAAPKPAAKKPVPAKPAKAAAKTAKPAPKAVAKAPAKTPAKTTAKVTAKTAKTTAKTASKVVKQAAKKVKAVAAKAVAKVTPKATAKPAPKAAAKPAPPAKVQKPAPAPQLKPVAVPPATAKAPTAPRVPAVPAPAPVVDEKKRTRRPRLRVTSSGAPAASWLSKDKPRAASFIPAPPRAEAPSAVAAPPASSDRLIRPEEVMELAVRTVPVRVDIEQGAGRFYVIANPFEVTLKQGEGIEWDFRYLGGADVNVEDVVVEFERPSPFQQAVFKTRKPGGARPHRQLSGPVQASAVGKRLQYTILAMSPFKTSLASAKMWLSVTA